MSANAIVANATTADPITVVNIADMEQFVANMRKELEDNQELLQTHDAEIGKHMAEIRALTASSKTDVPTKKSKAEKTQIKRAMKAAKNDRPEKIAKTVVAKTAVVETAAAPEAVLDGVGALVVRTTNFKVGTDVYGMLVAYFNRLGMRIEEAREGDSAGEQAVKSVNVTGLAHELMVRVCMGAQMFFKDVQDAARDVREVVVNTIALAKDQLQTLISGPGDDVATWFKNFGINLQDGCFIVLNGVFYKFLSLGDTPRRQRIGFAQPVRTGSRVSVWKRRRYDAYAKGPVTKKRRTLD
jgi:hypothetical protein